MAKIYIRKITAGEMTIEDVPTRWRDEVQMLLNKVQGELNEP